MAPESRQLRNAPGSGDAGPSTSSQHTPRLSNAAHSRARTTSATPSTSAAGASPSSSGGPAASSASANPYTAPWFNKLEEAKHHYTCSSFWLAEDVHECGAKRYRGFNSLMEYLVYVESMRSLEAPTRYYELIDASASLPVWAFFDADMPLPSGSALHEALAADMEHSAVEFARALISAFQEFLASLGYDIQPGVFEPGVNCQVANASRPAVGLKDAKLSLHLVFFIPLESMAVAKALAAAFSRHLKSLQADDPRCQLLDRVDGEPTIDQSVYKKNQSFRMLYNIKYGKPESILKPFLGSSECISAYLIGRYGAEAEAEAERNPNDTRLALLAPRSVSPLPSLASQLLTTSRARPARAAGVSPVAGPVAQRIAQQESGVPPGQMLSPAWPPGFVRCSEEADGKLERVLKSSSYIKRLLGILDGVQLEFRSKTPLEPDPRSAQPHICSLVVHEGCQPVCQYMGRAHDGNQISLHYNYHTQLIRVHCFSGKCTAEERSDAKIFSFRHAREDENSMSNLHDCEEAVPWADTYTETEMRQYPNDHAVVAIRARMGTGKTKEMYNLILGPLRHEPILLLTHRCSLAYKYTHQLNDTETRRQAVLKHMERTRCPESEQELMGSLPEFTCYLDAPDGPLESEHIVVCVNSAERIPMRSFGAVFVDEAVGVLSMLTSNLLRDNGTIITRITNLLAHAHRVYFLDAFADTTIVAEFAALLAHLKGAPSVTWIRNQCLIKRDDSARQTTILLLERARDRPAFTAAFLRHILSSLEAGRKVYVPCTTRSCALLVEEMVKLQRPSTAHRIYTRATPSEEKADAIANVHTAWAEVDLVIANNALESGISYEDTRFTEVIVWAQNCLEHGAPVFSILQQMFRVRNLGPDGKMTVYTSGSEEGQRAGGEPDKYPCTSEGVDQLLAAQQGAVLSYMPEKLLMGARYTVCRVPGSSGSCNQRQGQQLAASGSGQQQPAAASSSSSSGGQQRTLAECWSPPVTPLYALEYDTKSPSYYLLRGTLVMRHKSNVFWSSIITNTLRDEYKLPITPDVFNPGSVCDDDKAMLAAARGEAAKAATIQFSSDLLLSDAEWERLRSLRRSGETLTAQQEQQLHTTTVFRRRWKISNDALFDMEFYDKYVGMCSKEADMEKKLRAFYAFRRAVEVLHFTDSELELRRQFQRAMQKEVARASASSAIHQTGPRTFG